MRIGFISTYPPTECGIATYTQYLTDAVRDLGHEVCVVCHVGGTGADVFPCLDFDDGDLAEQAFRTMIRLTPDVVHIQHEFGLLMEPIAASAALAAFDQFRQMIQQHGDALKDHADSINAHEAALELHERTMVQYEREGKTQPRFDTASKSHEQQAIEHLNQHETHERMKREHHTVVAQLEMLKATAAKRDEGEQEVRN